MLISISNHRSGTIFCPVRGNAWLRRGAGGKSWSSWIAFCSTVFFFLSLPALSVSFSSVLPLNSTSKQTTEPACTITWYPFARAVRKKALRQKRLPVARSRTGVRTDLRGLKWVSAFLSGGSMETGASANITQGCGKSGLENVGEIGWWKVRRSERRRRKYGTGPVVSKRIPKRLSTSYSLGWCAFFCGHECHCWGWFWYTRACAVQTPKPRTFRTFAAVCVSPVWFGQVCQVDSGAVPSTGTATNKNASEETGYTKRNEEMKTIFPYSCTSFFNLLFPTASHGSLGFHRTAHRRVVGLYTTVAARF